MTIDMTELELIASAAALELCDAPGSDELARALADLAHGNASLIEIKGDGDGGGGNRARSGSDLMIGELRIDLLSRDVEMAGEPVQLTPKEFEILAFLAQNRGIVFSKEQIYRAVWHDEYLLDDSNIMAFIRKLRKKIEPEPDNPRYILTVWGVGYKMQD